ncbi:glycoside hydrolase family 16 protein [Croceibacterium ferulae]|uniref:glycoside hydrolase family 16 protein n=1 Tax=Croceibacterium ferulae TaxID=1854641 RepID=UPI001F4E4AC7|nr:glycoside hydrolase family 16 protein [Croceibacterium ferulae]
MRCFAIAVAMLLAGTATTGCAPQDRGGAGSSDGQVVSSTGLGASNYGVDMAMTAPRGEPSFADEFGGAAIDRDKWRYDVSRNKVGWYNNELQYYSAGRPENARTEDGLLIIEARRETLDNLPDHGGQAYSSAKLVTQQPLGFGFYEIRAQLPCGRGIWPAIWMLPQGGTWPEQGEIDIMEMVGMNPGVVLGTLHTGAFNHAKGTQRGAETLVPDACTAMHSYQLDWQPDAITIGVDGRGFMQVRNDQPGGHAAWPFTRPFDLILNVAVGGDWGGQKGVDDSAFPQAMKVDHVRHWAREP